MGWVVGYFIKPLLHPKPIYPDLPIVAYPSVVAYPYCAWGVNTPWILQDGILKCLQGEDLHGFGMPDRRMGARYIALDQKDSLGFYFSPNAIGRYHNLDLFSRIKGLVVSVS